MDDAIVDEAVWTEARRRATIFARTLPDAPDSQRLSISEAARELNIDRSTAFRWRARLEPELHRAQPRTLALVPRPHVPATVAAHRHEPAAAPHPCYRSWRPPAARPYATWPRVGQIGATVGLH